MRVEGSAGQLEQMGHVSVGFHRSEDGGFSFHHLITTPLICVCPSTRLLGRLYQCPTPTYHTCRLLLHNIRPMPNHREPQQRCLSATTLTLHRHHRHHLRCHEARDAHSIACPHILSSAAHSRAITTSPCSANHRYLSSAPASRNACSRGHLYLNSDPASALQHRLLNARHRNLNRA